MSRNKCDSFSFAERKRERDEGSKAVDSLNSTFEFGIFPVPEFILNCFLSKTDKIPSTSDIVV